MVRHVKVQEAKTHLSALLAAVEDGDEIIISRGDVEVARIVGLEPRSERPLGFVASPPIPDSFFDPLPDVELDLWEGRR
jgi:prevent-host-death family protein